MSLAPSSSSPPWRPSSRLAGALILLTLLAGLLYVLRTLLLPILLALLLAYMLAPLVHLLERRAKVPRVAGALILFLVLALLLGGAATGLGLVASQQLGGLIHDLIQLSNQLPDQLEQIAESQLVLGPWTIDLSAANVEPFVSALASVLQPFLSQTGRLLATLASATAEAVGVIALVSLLAFYMLVDLDGAEERLAGWAPAEFQDDALRLLHETTRVWRAFVRGQLVLALVLGVVVAVVLAALGVRFALVLGLLAGILDVVPFFGPTLAGLIAVVVAFFQGANWWGLHPLAFAGIVLAAFILIQQIENSVLIPAILGYSLKTRPLTILLAAMAGASLAGVIGVLLAQPVTAMLRVWLTYFYRKTAGLDPWPEPPEPPEPTPAARRPFWLRLRGKPAAEGADDAA